MFLFQNRDRMTDIGPIWVATKAIERGWSARIFAPRCKLEKSRPLIYELRISNVNLGLLLQCSAPMIEAYNVKKLWDARVRVSTRSPQIFAFFIMAGLHKICDFAAI